MSKFAAASLLSLLSTTPAMALTEFERLVIEELSCQSPPHPTRILRELQRSGQINPSDNIGYDSLSCWRLKSSVVVIGMTFSSVCAFEEDAEIRSRNDDLYYRGPGTSPGQTLSFGTTVGGDALSDWYLEVFGASNVSSAVSEDNMTTLGDVSEVSCTSWMQ